MLGFVIAVLACTGTNCDLIQVDPAVSYPSYEACKADLGPKAPSYKALLDQHRGGGRTADAVCIQKIETIIDVEEPYDVLDTAIVHSEPSANATYVGIVESGQRTLVTGVVSGTQWMRVLLPDGKSGFVFGDRLRKVGGAPPASQPPPPPPSVAQAAPGTPAAPAPQPPAAVPPLAPPPPPPAAQVTIPVPPAAPAPEAAQQPAQQASQQPRENTAANRAVGPKPATQKHDHEFQDCASCPTMLPIPGGEFIMGSNADPSERPIHRVTIRPFAIAKFELSTAEWQACVDGGGCSYKPAEQEANPARRPMLNLSWIDAGQYVKWLAKTTGKPYRLLSEAEWEYAARAGTRTRYSWGEELKPGMADCNGCGPNHDPTHPTDLGSFPPNAWGLYDMEGNVAEWVEDCWHTSYQGAPDKGEPWRAANCRSHVLRGGSWNNPPTDITVSTRNFYDANVRYIANSLRVGLTVR